MRAAALPAVPAQALVVRTVCIGPMLRPSQACSDGIQLAGDVCTRAAELRAVPAEALTLREAAKRACPVLQLQAQLVS